MNLERAHILEMVLLFLFGTVSFDTIEKYKTLSLLYYENTKIVITEIKN